MSPNLSTSSLRSILALSEKRDGLLAQIQEIDSKISSTFEIAKGPESGNKVNRRKPGRPAKAPVLSSAAAKKAKKGKHGRVKELILAGLREAGEAGIAVRHLATKLGLKPQNLHVWFHTTGKKNGLTEALGKGVYRLKKSLGVEIPQSSLEASKPKAPRKARKAKRKSSAKNKA